MHFLVAMRAILASVECELCLIGVLAYHTVLVSFECALVARMLCPPAGLTGLRPRLEGPDPGNLIAVRARSTNLFVCSVLHIVSII